MGGAKNQIAQRGGIENVEFGGVPFKCGKKNGVANAGDLDRFAKAAPHVARREGAEKAEIVDDGGGNGKGSDEILFPESVDAIFHADTGIGLA